MSKQVLEREVVDYARRLVKAQGGEMRKVVWHGRRSAPDWFIMLPARVVIEDHYDPEAGKVRESKRRLPELCFFAEFKRPGAVPTSAQQREIDRLRSFGADVRVIDGEQAIIDAVLIG